MIFNIKSLKNDFGDQVRPSRVHFTMDLGVTGQNQDFQPITLAMTHQAHGQKWHKNKAGSGDQERES